MISSGFFVLKGSVFSANYVEIIGFSLPKQVLPESYKKEEIFS